VGNYVVNVDNALSDVRIWRTIVAGYPYCTPAQMGVENWEDAYVSTKQAIYSIMYGRNVREFYSGGDHRGNLIVDCIERLVNEGRYGTRTPQSANVQINKVGSFVEQGNYYSQTFSVSAGVNISSYTIGSTANMPVRRICSGYE